jgi:transcriptional regulator with XRE-family HTH domain
VAISKTARQAFGRRVASLRDERELTQIELGNRVGVSGTCVWNWEGGNTFPRSAALSKLAHALGTSVEYLSSGIGSATPSNANGSAHRSLADVIMEARQAVAIAGGVPVSKVRIVIDYGE